MRVAWGRHIRNFLHFYCKGHFRNKNSNGQLIFKLCGNGKYRLQKLENHFFTKSIIDSRLWLITSLFSALIFRLMVLKESVTKVMFHIVPKPCKFCSIAMVLLIASFGYSSFLNFSAFSIPSLNFNFAFSISMGLTSMPGFLNTSSSFCTAISPFPMTKVVILSVDLL